MPRSFPRKEQAKESHTVIMYCSNHSPGGQSLERCQGALVDTSPTHHTQSFTQSDTALTAAIPALVGLR